TAGDGPDTSDRATVLPLRFGGDLLGDLRVLPRRPGELYTAADARLLAALALQVAVVVRAFQLAEQLEQARDRVVAAADQERDRLRADLHDGLGPSLSGIGLGLQALADAIDSGDKGTSTTLLHRIQEEVPRTLGEVRRIISGLRPSALDTMTLAEAIRRQAETMSASVAVDVVVAGLPALPSHVENAVYKIASEALTNITRHANARAVHVRLVSADHRLTVIVRDDGNGGASEVGGVGLSSMRRRAEDLGGRLDIESGDTGTVIVATIPLEQP
ncbi:MAG: sensor histidine kinase, partial [Actinoplanes sp.]